MIKLQTSLIWPGCAQGKYIVKAKGFILAVFRWGNVEAPLNDWGPFAYVPIDPAGNGMFFFSGKRGIPKSVTHVWARCYPDDFSSYEDVSVEIPDKYKTDSECGGDAHHFSILTDLHLAAKPWKIKQALQATESNTVFLLGDSTNDGLPEQFDEFRTCIQEIIPEKTVFSVPGNHDITHPRLIGKDADGTISYGGFQRCLLSKAEGNGYAISYAPDGSTYAVQIDDLDVIGLQCVTTGRKFLFPEGNQLNWLEKHLENTAASWHLILCHAPLLKHNPNRSVGAPYLDKNKRLQEIVDRYGRIIFLSGHTHVSPNVITGNGEYDEEHENIYLDCGSVVATDTSGETGIMCPDWKDGVKTELVVSKDSVEICMKSISSGIKFPRGYYRFSKEPVRMIIGGAEHGIIGKTVRQE